jgi:hypothetical protein
VEASATTPTLAVEVDIDVPASDAALETDDVVFMRVTAPMSANAATHTINERQ